MLDPALLTQLAQRFGLRFVKAAPTTYVLHFRNGKVVHEGAGLAFLYFAPVSTIVQVPLASVDVPFVFEQTTSDFQRVSVQGQLTFRVADPKRLAGLLDFSVDADGRYRSEDPQKLKDRLVVAAQVLTQAVSGRLSLREALVGSERMVVEVLAGLRVAESVQMLGLEVLGFSIVAVRSTPEMAKALEADAREALLRRADDAVYARRNGAVEHERTIRENELRTEVVVEEKRRQIRETQLAADVAVEQARTALIDLSSVNDRKRADTTAYALEATVRPLRDVDWRVLTAITTGGADPKVMIATAFRELAQHAQKVGELNVSPDLLRSLLDPKT